MKALIFLLFVGVTFAFAPEVHYENHLQCDENKHNPDSSRCTFSEVTGDQHTVWHYDPSPDTRWTYKIKPPKIIEAIFTQCSFPEIPKGLFEYYTNIRTLTVRQASIIGIFKYTFVGATKLYKLDLSFNNVTTITDKVFGDCATLAYISMADNRLEKLGEFAFYGLRQLKSLNLANNKLRELPAGLFAALGNLEVLDLGGNNLHGVYELQFMKNPRLSHLDLSHNAIKEVNGKMFQTMRNLTVLNLAYNQLREFSTEWFIVKKLFLTGNFIEYVYIVHDIEVLDAGDNRIKGLKMKPGVAVGSLRVRNNSISDVTQFCTITTLHSLDFSYNPVQIDEHTLQGLKQLETLDLQHCGLKKLPRGFLANQKNLKNLNLAHNQLDAFESYWLHSTNRLVNLYLDGNRLTDFNFNAIKHKFDNFSEIGLSNNAFDCNYLKDLVAQIRQHKVKIFFEEPVSTSANVEFIGCIEQPAHFIACDEKFGSKCTFSHVNGNLHEYWRYEAFVEVTIIEEIMFTDSSIKEIPRGLLQYFRNVRTLTVTECYIEEIYEYTFTGGQALTEIDLSRNKIKELKPSVFTECISITELLIEYNTISIIQPGAFDGLKQLQHLGLAGNDITKLDGQIFAPLSAMKAIDLSGNEIYIIDEFVFDYNPHLELIDLSKNNIKQVPTNLFEHQGQPVSVNLEGNALQTYEPILNVEEIFLGENVLEIVTIPAQTQHFRCENNNIKSIQVYENTEYIITELILRNNSLQDISGLAKLPTLESLDLSFNHLLLTPETFQHNPNLKVLRLVQCEITTIYETYFSNLPDLQVLDLSKNNLETFDLKSIKNNQKLSALNLAGCQLTTIQHLELLQNHFPQLKEIFLGDNKFSCQYLRKLVDYLRSRGINVVVPNPVAPSPNSYEGIACETSSSNPDVEIMHSGLEDKLSSGKYEGNEPEYQPGPGEPVCCTEIVQLRAKVKLLEDEIRACKSKAIEYVNQAMEVKSQEIENNLREMVKEMLNEKSRANSGNTYLHSRFQNKEFTG